MRLTLGRIGDRGTGTIHRVVKSFYKGERLGKLPPCAICMGRGQGPRAQFHLPNGVSVWLCAAHRSHEFQTSRAGRDLFASLDAVWRAAGCLTTARSRALRCHRGRFLAPAPKTRRPGSYAWPELRREAERRFAAGEPPGRVIADLRARAGRGDARPPSVPTMRRWFQEARWLDAGQALSPSGPAPSATRDRGVPPRGPAVDERDPPAASPLIGGSARPGITG